MVTTDFDPPEKLFISKDSKFFNRLLSKESASDGNTSFRVYYGVAPGEIPFQWETRPGTPKRPAFKSELPPLTPPPAFRISPCPSSSKHPARPKSTIISRIGFPKFLTAWKIRQAPSNKTLAINYHDRARYSHSSSTSSLWFSGGTCDEELRFSTVPSPTKPLRTGQIQKSYSGGRCLPMNMPVKNVLWPTSWHFGRSTSLNSTKLIHSCSYYP